MVAPNTTELSPEERAFGDFRVGRYGWRFRKPQLLDKPVPMTGRLGIFEPADGLIYGTCLPPLSLVSTAFRAEALPGPLELGCTSDDHLAADIPHPCQQAFLWAAHRLSVPAASNA